MLASPFIAAIGCSAGDPQAAVNPTGKLNPTQEANARAMGIETPDSIKRDPGRYTGSVNTAQAGVDAQNKKVADENAAIKAMTGH